MTKEEGSTFGVRQLLAEVNLRDFSKMVRGELALVGSSVRLAVESRRLLTPLILFVALFRIVLLGFVIVVLGGAILLVTIARGVARAARDSTRVPRGRS